MFPEKYLNMVDATEVLRIGQQYDKLCQMYKIAPSKWQIVNARETSTHLILKNNQDKPVAYYSFKKFKFSKIRGRGQRDWFEL